VKGTTLLLFVTVQRAIELVIAARNTKALRRRGAYEAGADHYPVMVALHASWLTTLWLQGRGRVVSRPLLGVFILLQAGRAWVLSTLGERWTTRIMILPEAAPVVSGPYRFVRHPNYLIVALELPCVALALGLRRHALLFGGANLAMLAWRVRCEDRAFADAMARNCQVENEPMERNPVNPGQLGGPGSDTSTETV
jgi:methyltransferase